MAGGLGRAARAAATFMVETFASAEDFLASDQLKQTACLILDIQMPGLNGLDLQRHLVTSGYQIRIIVITAFNDDGARAHRLKAGALGYLVKLFEDSDLIGCINRALRPQTDQHQPAAQH